ncbi:hypothetical protein [Pseudovibrio sp. Ad26]|uniref:hypothetical protein n=1 Tax=Pseudovibrio sp. Ad26 TaxID=989410 RepID=UPI0007AE5205|nr:hypothetical protein [Pseudovibrio sp. Ad26]KZL10719.1 hypothetical protein PsAD26_03084 [Pseudovibrio sp. Ad26]
MATTPNLNLPLLDSAENVSEDHQKINVFLQALDARLGEIAVTLASLAVAGHSHEIAKINGLAEALALRALTDHLHKLNDLSDVNVTDAPDGSVLQKVGGAWGFGGRGYSVAEINNLLAEKVSVAGLQSDLDATRDAAVAVVMGGATTAQLDTLKELSEALLDNDSEIAALISSMATKAGWNISNTFAARQYCSVDGGHGSWEAFGYGGVDHGSALVLGIARGSKANPEYLKYGDLIASVRARPWIGSFGATKGMLVWLATQDHGPDQFGTEARVAVTPNGQTAPQVAAIFRNDLSLQVSGDKIFIGPSKDEAIHEGNLVEKAAAVGIGSVYEGSNANNLNFPIGTIIAVAAPTNTYLQRNKAYTVRLGTDTRYYSTTGGGSALIGTWACRGMSGDWGSGNYVYNFQRIA